jgi:hypothetical protein
MNKIGILLFVMMGLGFMACEPAAQEMIVGKWKYSRLVKNGKAFLSNDPAESKRIIDKLVSENQDYVKDVAKFRENAEEEMEQRLNVFLEFKSDSTLSIITKTSGADLVENWKYSINEETKNMVIESGERKIQYVYNLEKDKLKLSDGPLKIELEKVEQ